MNGMLPSVGILMIGRWIKEDADMLTWEFNRTGVFDTHSYYHALRDSTCASRFYSDDLPLEKYLGG